MNLNKLYFVQKYDAKSWVREYKRWWWLKEFDRPINLQREFTGIWVDEFKDHATDAMRYIIREGKEL